MKIQVTVKTVYGNNMIYPVCDFSKIFCELTRKKTLDSTDVKNIKALGYQVEIVPDATNPVLAEFVN
jgi:hypothetical protein